MSLVNRAPIRCRKCRFVIEPGRGLIDRVASEWIGVHSGACPMPRAYSIIETLRPLDAEWTGTHWEGPDAYLQEMGRSELNPDEGDHH